MKIHFITFMVLLLASCSMHEDTYYRNLEINKAVFGSNNSYIQDSVEVPALGITIDFENVDGYIKKRSSNNMYIYGKSINKEHWHTAALIIYEIFPTKNGFENKKEFIEKVKFDLEKLRDQNGADLVFDIKPDEEEDKWCVYFHKKIKTNTQKDLPGIMFIHESYEAICKHPYRLNMYVNIGYSERFIDGNGITQTLDRARDLHSSISFRR